MAKWLRVEACERLSRYGSWAVEWAKVVQLAGGADVGQHLSLYKLHFNVNEKTHKYIKLTIKSLGQIADKRSESFL